MDYSYQAYNTKTKKTRHIDTTTSITKKDYLMRANIFKKYLEKDEILLLFSFDWKRGNKLIGRVA